MKYHFIIIINHDDKVIIRNTKVVNKIMCLESKGIFKIFLFNKASFSCSELKT